jgi:hypothetical protein
METAGRQAVPGKQVAGTSRAQHSKTTQTEVPAGAESANPVKTKSLKLLKATVKVSGQD